MLDPMSQRIIVSRKNDERLAEVRRDHLLRAAREERDAFEVRPRVASPSLRSTLAAAMGAARHGLTQHAGGRAHSAPAR